MPLSCLSHVVSGGQTGVDRAALRAARATGLRTGGWCPPGRAAEDGVVPKDFPLRETSTDRSESAPLVPRSMRTELNVRDSDATLVFLSAVVRGDGDCCEDSSLSEDVVLSRCKLENSKAVIDPGTNWTLDCVTHLSRPCLVLDLGKYDNRLLSYSATPKEDEMADMICRWIQEKDIGVLNVAGSSEESCKGIEKQVFGILLKAFGKLE